MKLLRWPSVGEGLGVCDYCKQPAIVKVNELRACRNPVHINKAMAAAVAAVHQLVDEIRRDQNGAT